jgi:membrane protease YdiL (CAAX protease family)
MPAFSPIAIWFLFLFCLFVPYIIIKSARAVRAGAALPPRPKRFRNIVLMECFFLACALFAAWMGRIPVFTLGTVNVAAIALATIMIAIGLGAMPLFWKFASDERRRRALLTRPRDASELGYWLAVSLAAGVVEEIVYRGVMLSFFLPITRNWYAAVGFCAFFFALGHINQGWSRTVFIGALAIGFHALVAITGSLYLAMAAHFLYDFLAGIVYIRFARELASAPA